MVSTKYVSIPQKHSIVFPVNVISLPNQTKDDYMIIDYIISAITYISWIFKSAKKWENKRYTSIFSCRRKKIKKELLDISCFSYNTITIFIHSIVLGWKWEDIAERSAAYLVSARGTISFPR